MISHISFEALNDLSYDAFEYYVELVSTLSSYSRERFLHCYLICDVLYVVLE